ncbi:Predicted oxidoreductase [Loktanella sp. DSM 29012]|uniref:aldo/keto reductase n=1 Tax=Loktanella sp. DSM 29012 TaxID=1881056 RepID=UPI0008B10293|nr:aldo/keto reductase [Loktanella sp. DSM 29012]SEQ85913.1 Predicted oxidoreductase [Loktanella sp. DSM 29012]
MNTPTSNVKNTDMPCQRLGEKGPTVSRHALGTMTFGAETDEGEAHNMLDLFVARGGTLIDTADVYSDGASEEMIGRWGVARGGMDDLIVATKCRFSATPGSRGGSRRAVLKRVDASLERLKLDAIDLFFIHGWDDETDVAETLGALGDLLRAGKIHHVGWSNVTGWQLERICRIAEANGLPVPCALQPQYSLLDRGIELEVLPCALENGIGLIPWSPLGGGWLTGKYAADERPTGATRLGDDPNRGVEAYETRNTERTHNILRATSAVAARHGRPMSHVALAWLASRPGVASILLGARHADQLADNLDAVGLALDQEDIEVLTQASCTPLPDYPYGFVRDWSGVVHWDRFDAP